MNAITQLRLCVIFDNTDIATECCFFQNVLFSYITRIGHFIAQQRHIMHTTTYIWTYSIFPAELSAVRMTINFSYVFSFAKYFVVVVEWAAINDVSSVLIHIAQCTRCSFLFVNIVHYCWLQICTDVTSIWIYRNVEDILILLIIFLIHSPYEYIVNICCLFVLWKYADFLNRICSILLLGHIIPVYKSNYMGKVRTYKIMWCIFYYLIAGRLLASG